MKKLFFVFVLFATFCFNCGITYAECSNEKIIELKEKSKNIEIKYELQDPEDGDFGKVEGSFDVIITNIEDNFYVTDDYFKYNFTVLDINDDGNILLKNYVSGKHAFEIYSNECNTLLRTVIINIPVFNVYSRDPLCEGISGDELKVCDEWYENNLTYEEFEKTVNNYKNNQNEIEEKEEENFLYSLKDFFSNNYIYIISSLVIVSIIVIIIIIMRKRSELK